MNTLAKPSQTRGPCGSNRNRAFTLIEVLISLAIAMILILGISQIFSMAQRTTGAGTQVLTAAETNRGIQAMLQSDVQSIDDGSDAPGMAIISYPAATFRNRVDQEQDVDGVATTINNPANPALSISAGVSNQISDRIHRVDVLCFFARGRYARRTGQAPSSPTKFDPQCLVSPTTTREAFIWYGHLALPDNLTLSKWSATAPQTGTFMAPGQGTLATNPNNFFASDWILGRQVILLSPPPVSGTWENHFMGLSLKKPIDPLLIGATTINSEAQSSDDFIPLFASRYDLADATIATYTQFITANNYMNWWQGCTGVVMPGSRITNQVRYAGNPFIQKPGPSGPNPMQTLGAAVAQASPIFVRGCTQFIVEFAGDYLDQTQTPAVAGHDGQIDYTIDPVTNAHLIRWYGFPRDTTGTGTVNPTHGVLPLSTVLGSSTPVEFERAVPPNTAPPWVNNTQTSAQGNGLPGTYALPYVCAWDQFSDKYGIPRPKMLRITVGVDEPTGHLNTQQLFEYIINLP
jgi:prepilin-type N-terminal cleavage/methylation domain-containing protein